MTIALHPQLIILAYWLVVILLGAFFLRQACSVCGAGMPTWRRSIVSVIIVTFLAYLAFDFASYMIMESMGGIFLYIPPWYGYNFWFRESLGLKLYIISQAGPLRFVPFILATWRRGRRSSSPTTRSSPRTGGSSSPPRRTTSSSV